MIKFCGSCGELDEIFVGTLCYTCDTENFEMLWLGEFDETKTF